VQQALKEKTIKKDINDKNKRKMRKDNSKGGNLSNLKGNNKLDDKANLQRVEALATIKERRKILTK
jgi:hypothetical protein